jgi:predicted PurR-regulated permease PerM
MASPDAPLPVPMLLRNGAGWVWRLLVVAAGAYALVWLLDRLYLLVLPIIGAVFIAALLRPLVLFFHQRGLHRGLATWLTILIGLAIFGGVVFFVVNRVTSASGTLAAQLTDLVHHVRNILVRDFHLKTKSVNSLETRVVNFINQHRSTLVHGVLSTAVAIGQAAAGAVLAFFTTFYLLYDGDRIWDWLVGVFPARARSRVHDAGREAFGRISGWVRGTFLIAVFHALVVAAVLAGLGSPLVAPLALLMFLGSFIPIVGSLIFGTLAALVTLVNLGLVPALILGGVLILDSQVEAHLLQPFLVGRYVRLHPLAVVIIIAGGGLLEGIEGAIVALPITSAMYAAMRSLAETAPRAQLQPTP